MQEGKITVGNASKIFAGFEQQTADYLSTLHVQHFALWQILKWPLLSICLKNHNQTADSTVVSNITKKPFLIRAVKNALIILQESYLIFRLQLIKYPPRLFITYSADKLAVNENNLYYNSLMDPVIDYFVQQKIPFLHFEYDIKSKQPAYRNGLYDISKIDLIRRFFKEPLIDCNELVQKMNAYFKSELIDAEVTAEHINTVLQNFFFQKKIWNKIFKRSRPVRIFTSEVTSTGMLAACNELGIEVYEFQHGTIDKDHPKYAIQKSIVATANQLKPEAYVVFGQSTTQTLRLHAFNNSINIIELGKKSMEDARTDVMRKNGSGVLLCLQPYMEQFNEDIINTINQQQDGIIFTITLKFHPLQKPEERAKLKALIKNNKKIKLASTSEKIHHLIAMHDIVAAHASHVLEESISLNRPAITISTIDTPGGILDILDMPFLQNAIRPVSISNIKAVISRFYTEDNYKEAWLAEVKKYSSFFYTENYCRNIKKIL